MQPIHHTLAPLANAAQRRLALGLLFTPWKWRKGTAIDELRSTFTSRFGGEAFFFGSGRESLLSVLRSLKLTQGEEVIIQGYTCIVVPNAIQAARLVPIYADISRDTLNLDLESVEQAITPRTRAIICQHTFGIPADTIGLRKICDQHSLLLIEDCAHVMPDTSGPHEIGKHGDVLFFSFGRDKGISGITGGAVICKNPDICSFLKREEEKAAAFPITQIPRLLLYPILYGLARPFYTSFGKALLALAGKLGVLVPIVTKQEKEGVMSPTVHTLPNAFARLALEQYKHLEAINNHRRQLVSFYLAHGIEHGWFATSKPDGSLPLGVHPDLPLQKFPLFVRNADHIRRVLKRRNIHLNDGWTGCVVCPIPDCEEAAQYDRGSDPTAEEVSESILSLPTHPGMSLQQAENLATELDMLFGKQ